MKLLPLLVIGGIGLALYKASSAQAQATTPRTTSGGVTLPGITIPSRVHLTRTDILVARGLLNPSVRFILPNGSTPVGSYGAGRYLDLQGLTASQRLQALQMAINSIDYDLRYGTAPQASLFDTLMGDDGN
jgi:hypothetical protein